MSGRRGGRARRGSGIAGAARGLFGLALLAVLLVFAASMLGWLRPGGEAPAPPSPREGSAARGLPALLERPSAGGAPATARPAERGVIRPDEQVRVFVSNGCGVPRLAARMREEFRWAGFDVCGVSTADADDYGETVVIDRCGEPGKAEAVRLHLQARYGVGRLVRQVRNSPETDVIVILGADLAARLAESAPGP